MWSQYERLAGGCIQMHKRPLHYIYSSQGSTATVLSEWTKWAGHAAHIKETRSAYTIFIEMPG